MGQQNSGEPSRPREAARRTSSPRSPLAYGSPVTDTSQHPASSHSHRDPNSGNLFATTHRRTTTTTHTTGSNSPTNGDSVSTHDGVATHSGPRYPVVLRYTDHDVKKLLSTQTPMYVAVEAMGWQPLPMTPSADSFYALTELPAGHHNYRFLVEGTEIVDRSQPLAPSPLQPSSFPGVPHDEGKPCADQKPGNTIFVNNVLLCTKEDDDILDDGEGWGQEPVLFEETRKYPPIIPPHLRYTPLNTPPTLVRCTRDGTMSVVETAEGHDAASAVAPEHLPLPLGVTVNHVYFQRREDHAVVGVTTRYGNKYTTVVYYTTMKGVTSSSEGRDEAEETSNVAT